jgi:NhaP-type Na+/H+ or K+/H+ antiporter
MAMMEGETKYVAGLLAVGLALGIGAYLFGDGLYFIAVLVILVAVLVEAIRVAIFGKDRKKLRELWTELKDAFWSF